jgi:hypothetical protein
MFGILKNPHFTLTTIPTFKIMIKVQILYLSPMVLVTNINKDSYKYP